MTFRFVICPDPDFTEITAANTRFARNEKEVAKQVQAIAGLITEGSICVFELSELHKMVEKPKFAKYKMQSNGEILPI